MGQKCTICKHSKRLEIEREVLKGAPYVRIGKAYGVGDVSVANHAKNHLSRQMLKSDEMKAVTHSKNLFAEIQDLIERTKAILSKAEDDDRPMISLSAINSLKSTFEFLIKFQVYMEQAQQADTKAERDSQVRDIKRLNIQEIMLMEKLVSKMSGSIAEDVDVLAEFKEDCIMRARMFRDPFKDNDSEKGFSTFKDSGFNGIDDDDVDFKDDIDVLPVKKTKSFKRKRRVDGDDKDDGDVVKQVVIGSRTLNTKNICPDADDGSIQIL